MYTSAKLFPEYSFLKDVPVEDYAPKPAIPSSHMFTSHDNLIQSIFAPDPVTGVPRSDIHIIMSKDSSPEVSQYIRDNLMRPLSFASGTDDADLAIESVRNRGESIRNYANRLRQIANKSFSE